MKKFDSDVVLAGLAFLAIVAITASVGYSHALTAISAPPARTASLDAKVAGQPMELVDPDGWVTRIARPPQRVVSVAIATDEMLLNLIPATRIAALSAFADLPSMSNVATEAKQVAGRIRGDAEAIIALEPDLVLATEFLAIEVVETLRGCGVPVHRLRRHESLTDILHDFTVLGAALGVDKDSVQKRATWDRRLKAVANRIAIRADRPSRPSRPSVLLLSPGGFTSGVGTLWDELVARSGGSNHATTLGIRGYGTLSIEQVLSDPPDWIIVAGQSSTDPAAADWLKADATWNRLPTVRDNRILILPARLLSTVSPYAVDCCELLATRLGEH